MASAEEYEPRDDRVLRRHRYGTLNSVTQKTPYERPKEGNKGFLASFRDRIGNIKSWFFGSAESQIESTNSERYINSSQIPVEHLSSVPSFPSTSQKSEPSSAAVQDSFQGKTHTQKPETPTIAPSTPAITQKPLHEFSTPLPSTTSLPSVASVLSQPAINPPFAAPATPSTSQLALFDQTGAIKPSPVRYPIAKTPTDVVRTFLYKNKDSGAQSPFAPKTSTHAPATPSFSASSALRANLTENQRRQAIFARTPISGRPKRERIPSEEELAQERHRAEENHLNKKRIIAQPIPSIQNPSLNNVPISSTAKRILETLDQITSPLADARKGLNSHTLRSSYVMVKKGTRTPLKASLPKLDDKEEISFSKPEKKLSQLSRRPAVSAFSSRVSTTASKRTELEPERAYAQTNSSSSSPVEDQDAISSAKRKNTDEKSREHPYIRRKKHTGLEKHAAAPEEEILDLDKEAEVFQGISAPPITSPISFNFHTSPQNITKESKPVVTLPQASALTFQFKDGDKTDSKQTKAKPIEEAPEEKKRKAEEETSKEKDDKRSEESIRAFPTTSFGDLFKPPAAGDQKPSELPSKSVFSGSPVQSTSLFSSIPTSSPSSSSFSSSTSSSVFSSTPATPIQFSFSSISSTSVFAGSPSTSGLSIFSSASSSSDSTSVSPSSSVFTSSSSSSLSSTSATSSPSASSSLFGFQIPTAPSTFSFLTSSAFSPGTTPTKEPSSSSGSFFDFTSSSLSTMQTPFSGFTSKTENATETSSAEKSQGDDTSAPTTEQSKVAPVETKESDDQESQPKKKAFTVESSSPSTGSAGFKFDFKASEPSEPSISSTTGFSFTSADSNKAKDESNSVFVFGSTKTEPPSTKPFSFLEGSKIGESSKDSAESSPFNFAPKDSGFKLNGAPAVNFGASGMTTTPTSTPITSTPSVAPSSFSFGESFTSPSVPPASNNSSSGFSFSLPPASATLHTGFNFTSNQPTASTAPTTSQPVFNFGASTPASSTPSASPNVFNFGATPSTPSSQSQLFSFGSNAPSSNGSNNSGGLFNFGSTTPKMDGVFGSPPSSSNAMSSSPGPSPFSTTNAAPAAGSSIPSSTFGFNFSSGSLPTNSASFGIGQSTPGFSFGQPAAGSSSFESSGMGMDSGAGFTIGATSGDPKRKIVKAKRANKKK